MIKVYNSLPTNLEKEFEYLYLDKQKYSVKPRKTKKLKNVFVSHWGILLYKFFIPIKSAENLVGLYDKTFYLKFWRLVLEQYFVCRFGKSLQSIKLTDSKDYFTIHTSWFGYFSWFTTNIPRLIKTHDTNPDAVLLLPERIAKMPFVVDSLKMFENLNIVEVKDAHHLFIKNYIFTEVRPWTSQFDSKDFEIVRTVCFNYLNKQNLSVKEMPFVYVSRKKAKRRTITNEVELETYLSSKGFYCISFEDYSVFEQIAIMQRVKVLITLHGAGLTNTIFMTAGSKVMELSPIIDEKSQFRFPFWRICNLLNISYYIQFCQTKDKGENDIYTRDLTVNMLTFVTKCEEMLSNSI